MKLSFILSPMLCAKTVPSVISSYKLDDCLRNPGFVKRQCWVFSELLENHLPKIHKILTEQNIDPIMYTPPWFLTLFSSCLSQQLFYRFFECFLIDGYSFMYKMALALLQVKEK